VGRGAIEADWKAVFGRIPKIDLQTKHILWIEDGDMAIHLVEESPVGAPGRPSMPVYATNIYRRGADGWRMILHQNTPAPPPANIRPEGFPHLP